MKLTLNIVQKAFPGERLFAKSLSSNSNIKKLRRTVLKFSKLLMRARNALAIIRW